MRNAKKLLSLFLTVAILLITCLPVSLIPSSAAVAEPAVQLQWTSPWQNYYYGGANYDNLYNSGCGMFSFCNAVYYLTGNNPSVTAVSQWAADNDYLNGTYAGTDHRFHANIGWKYGSTYGFSVVDGDGTWAGWSSSALKSHLANGGVAIGNVPNHYIAIVGYDYSTNKFHIYDSAPRSSCGTTGGNVWLSESQLNSYSLMTLDWYCLLSRTGTAPAWYGYGPSLGDAVNKGDFYAQIASTAYNKNLALNSSNKVEARAKSNDRSQIWHFVLKDSTDNSYAIINMSNGEYLDVSGASSANGTLVGSYTSNNNDNQRWYIVKKDNYYALQPKSAPDSALDINSGDATKVQIWEAGGNSNQLFNLVAHAHMGDSFYAQINNLAYNKNLSIDSDGYPIADDCAPVAEQTWQFVLKGAGDISYAIINTVTGKYLDVNNASSANGTDIVTYESNDASNQRWYIIPRANGYTLQPKCASGSTLDVNTGDQTDVKLWEYSGGNNQCWNILSHANIGDGFNAQLNCVANGKNISLNDNDYLIYDDKALDNKQVWRFVIRDASVNAYSIMNIANGEFLDVCDASSENGTLVHTYDYNNAHNQLWYIIPRENGYSLKPQCATGSSLDVNVNGTNKVQIWADSGANNQRFTVTEKVYVGNNFTAQLYNSEFDRVLSYDSNNYVVAAANTQTNDQVWTVVLSSSADNSYAIINQKSGKYLELVDGSAANGTRVAVADNSGADAQRWYFVYTADGMLTIRPKRAPKNSLDINSGDKTKVITWENSGGNNQKFSIVYTSAYTGWQQFNGVWYYYNDSGVMQTGWQQISNKWYYFNDSGAMQVGWQKISDKWYYLNESGERISGWQTLNGSKYYFDPSNNDAAATELLRLDNKAYMFNSSGVLQYLVGDADNDESATADDLILLKKSLIKSVSLSGNSALAVDMNGDGVVDLRDFIRFKLYLADNSTLIG